MGCTQTDFSRMVVRYGGHKSNGRRFIPKKGEVPLYECSTMKTNHYV